ncbi:TlyA family RNA methyltransferase [Streptobacillus moniliformis]|uniref:Hemolysin A n=1 Tax=Streptobacillus moniliformis (strain ATCC 14647 / DSM 12112 / NCTC 10651 / 9901) TaxID=519441 RepID=D1AXZ9_STRM9|nr:TlyA family RNA methyltransferase [Streptobacillus moniliformis]ACZ01175.1 hemolysin A [Streptobacillus moniliformis DSM 12112]AVL42465.1 TlyA family rRNA (cytidine-2'-O)-methyltransferase [Streptobacillus moniliformis]QXW65924.1 TlyA family RNA methyltransferase [Streptobacillus moniliformis]SQA13673.1 16S/23S rRNA (cytidine-2'-O)-methyltransferase TlyA [Streptobacillus moniliformis]
MKKRLDVLLVELGYFETREKAKREIMIGNVIINDRIETKAGTQFKEENIKDIRIKNKLKFVSRGGLKLEKAITYWNLDFKDKIILDIGASTGGFTDCALQNGAIKVFANDVGTNQLDYKLRSDERVISLEQIHVKDLELQEKVDYIVIDVSFISLTKVIPFFTKFSKEDTKVIALIKPQFEVGREKISKNGIVVDEKYHDEAIKKVISSFKDFNYEILDVIESPILGGKGNKEFLIYTKRSNL